MAKIYETKEDFERERLSKEARNARDSQSNLFNVGLFSTLLGSANITAGTLENQIKELKGIQNQGWLSRNMGRINYSIGLAFAAVGIAGFVASLSSRNKAIKAEDALAKLGPEQIVLPPGVGGDCPQKSYSKTVEPKTLIQQAAKLEGGVLSKG